MSIPKCKNLQLWVHNCLKKTNNLPLIIMLFQNLNGIVFQIVLPLHVGGHNIAIATWFSRTRLNRSSFIENKNLLPPKIWPHLMWDWLFLAHAKFLVLTNSYLCLVPTPPHNYSCCQYRTKINEAWKVQLGIETTNWNKLR